MNAWRVIVCPLQENTGYCMWTTPAGTESIKEWKKQEKRKWVSQICFIKMICVFNHCQSFVTTIWSYWPHFWPRGLLFNFFWAFPYFQQQSLVFWRHRGSFHWKCWKGQKGKKKKQNKVIDLNLLDVTEEKRRWRSADCSGSSEVGPSNADTFTPLTPELTCV